MTKAEEMAIIDALNEAEGRPRRRTEAEDLRDIARLLEAAGEKDYAEALLALAKVEA